MLLIALACLGGVPTIASPCMLPMLPFVFARADRPSMRSALPAAVANLAAVGGGWVVAANVYGRLAALALLSTGAMRTMCISCWDRRRRMVGRYASMSTIDGVPPGDDHGADINAAGDGTVNDQRLYQLARQNGTITDRMFEIRFLDPGVRPYAFTFG